MNSLAFLEGTSSHCEIGYSLPENPFQDVSITHYTWNAAAVFMK